MRTLLSLASMLALTSPWTAAAQPQPSELPEKVVLLLNGANTADETHEQLTLVEVGNVLRERGIDFTVVGKHDCTSTSDGCLDLRAEHGATAVVIVSVYRGDPGRVDLQLFDARRSGEGSQSWIGDPSTAAGQAMQGALETFAPESVQVVLNGTPEGATVWLGRRTGHLPFVATVSPGRHRLRVTADGYRTHVETLEVSATSEPFTHQVTLEAGEDPPDDAEPAEPPPPTGHGRGARIGGGAVALVAGAGAALGGVLLLTRNGCELEGCRRDPADLRLIRRKRTTGPAVGLLAAGLALTALGVGLTIAGLRVDATADTTGASLHLSGTF